MKLGLIVPLTLTCAVASGGAFLVRGTSAMANVPPRPEPTQEVIHLDFPLPSPSHVVEDFNPPVPPTTAVIRNSGSTNTYGYTIEVHRTSGVMYAYSSREGVEFGSVFPSTAKKFFADLAAARPLSGLKAAHCAKSASFGTKTTITWEGATSPDLQCAQDARGKALEKDVEAIVKAMHIRNVARSEGAPPPPLPGL